MKVTKKVIGSLEKCYSITGLTYKGGGHFLVAAEKENGCYLFDQEGNIEDTVWEGPGGVMSMVQVPDTDGCFLATQRFYSPNNSKEASIASVQPGKDGWKIRTLVKLPFVHRFDILRRNGVNYLIACTLKSGHQYKEDWTMPGKVYAARLPENWEEYDEYHPLSLTVIKSNLLKNHGYSKITGKESEHSLISCADGIYFFTPPEQEDGEWTYEKILEEGASDALLLDLDGDGEEELFVLSPFHGDTVSIYKKCNGNYKKVYEYLEKLPFLHAICGGVITGKPMVIIGNREGKRNLLAFTMNKEGIVHTQFIDAGCGAANIFCYKKGEKDILIAANREINEIAMYTLE